MAHGKPGWKGGWLFIHDRLKAQVPADLRSAADPVVAQLVAGIRNVSHVKVSPAPKAVGLGFDRLVHQPARDQRAGAVQPGHQQHPVGGMQESGVGRRVNRVVSWPGQSRLRVYDRQERQIAVHRGLVASQLHAQILSPLLLQLGIRGDAQGNTVTKDRIADFGIHNPRFCPGRLIGRSRHGVGARAPEFSLFERPLQGLLQSIAKLLSRHVFIG